MYRLVPTSKVHVRLIEDLKDKFGGPVREMTGDASPHVPPFVLEVLPSRIIVLHQPFLVMGVNDHIKSQAQGVVHNRCDPLRVIGVGIEIAIPIHGQADVFESRVVGPLDLLIDDFGIRIALIELINVSNVDPTTHSFDYPVTVASSGMIQDSGIPLDSNHLRVSLACSLLLSGRAPTLSSIVVDLRLDQRLHISVGCTVIATAWSRRKHQGEPGGENLQELSHTV
mmetsp:Transcript_21888/g.51304  ORF Transcript_21888/g.51304 Transcript_21888/m.51304 type:complete len:226 (+) Transcript_21888:734-1411(+)